MCWDPAARILLQVMKARASKHLASQMQEEATKAVKIKGIVRPSQGGLRPEPDAMRAVATTRKKVTVGCGDDPEDGGPGEKVDLHAKQKTPREVGVPVGVELGHGEFDDNDEPPPPM